MTKLGGQASSLEDDVEEEGEVEAEAGPTERSSYEVEFGQKSNRECELCQNKMGWKGPQHQSFWNIFRLHYLEKCDLIFDSPEEVSLRIYKKKQTNVAVERQLNINFFAFRNLM